MSEAGKRWASRLGRLAQLVLRHLSAAGSGLWLIPSYCADESPGDRQGATDEEQAPAVDPRELDAWLERVLGEAGTLD